MDQDRFDQVARRYARLLSRRAIAGALGFGALAFPGLSGAEKKHKHKRKHMKKVKRNAFGCVDVGKFCKNSGQCCSGICQGRKGQKQCQAHDTGNCPVGVQELFCQDTGADVPCVTSDGTDGLCDTTTGNAPIARAMAIASSARGMSTVCRSVARRRPASSVPTAKS